MDSIIKIFSASILAFVVFINSIGNFFGVGDLIVTQPEEPSTTAVVEEDTTLPDEPVFTEPATEPTTTKPTTTKPTTTKPTTTKPTTTKPTTTKPTTTKPTTTKPTTTKPTTTKPTTTKPTTTKPTTTKPTTTKPVTTPPETTTKPVENNVQRIVVDGNEIFFGCDYGTITSVLGNATDVIYESKKDGKNITSLIYASDYSELAVYQLVDGVFSGFYTIDTDAVVTDGENTYSIANSGATSQSKLNIKEYTDSHQSDIVYAIYVSYNGFYYRAKDLNSQDGQSTLNFHVVNGLRAVHGVYALNYCEKAEAAINLHCTDMAERNYFDHASPEGGQVWDRLEAQGIDYRTCAENILYSSSGNVFAFADAWYNSKSGHREGMLSTSYDYVGIAFVVAENGITYGGQNFYRPYYF